MVLALLAGMLFTFGLSVRLLVWVFSWLLAMAQG